MRSMSLLLRIGHVRGVVLAQLLLLAIEVMILLDTPLLGHYLVA